jgi:hypothetical protein
VQDRLATLTESRIIMASAEIVNALMAQVKAHADSVETAGELYEILMYVGEITAQRAHEIQMGHSKDTRAFEWLTQVKNDATSASDNAERMIYWIEDENS